MNSLVKSCTLATLLSLTMATTARATQLDSTTTNTKPAESQSLIIAQNNAPIDTGPSTSYFFDQMIMMHMKMADMGQQMLQTQGDKMAPETRKMVQEMVDYSNAQILKLVGERERLFRVNRQGR